MNWKKRFVSQKLNVKFTLVIILFMVIPIGILAGILFYKMKRKNYEMPSVEEVLVLVEQGFAASQVEKPDRCLWSRDRFRSKIGRAHV